MAVLQCWYSGGTCEVEGHPLHPDQPVEPWLGLAVLDPLMQIEASVPLAKGLAGLVSRMGSEQDSRFKIQARSQAES